jgi:L-alanine-DL-glutamate epimerase-like enolase superfamily enzyme
LTRLRTAIHHFSAIVALLHEPLFLLVSQAPCSTISAAARHCVPHLVKCGGIRHALKMIHVARAHNLLVMIGCMIESSLAITAAAHLTPLVDYADLDGHLLINDDPYLGVTVEKGKLVLPDARGLGVKARS